LSFVGTAPSAVAVVALSISFSLLILTRLVLLIQTFPETAGLFATLDRTL
jgi:hypothetical protein